jgi:hypothetical protein
MKRAVKAKSQEVTALLIKKDPALPALLVTGRQAISIRADTTFNGRRFAKHTPIRTDELKPGADYAVWVDGGISAISVTELTGIPEGGHLLGGFHFAPGGNAKACAGGDSAPAINPFSLWDLNFRPACADPRGMVLIDSPRKFWCDIYLTGADHLNNGTSKFGVTIADGDDPPGDPEGGRFPGFDYKTAVAVMKHHGKELLSLEEFFAAAYGVTEKTSCGREPKITALDVARTSKFGLMQATGNMWVWGHNGDPDMPRASVFGGSWRYVGSAGSRFADVGHWPDYSGGGLGARGRCDPCGLTSRRESAGRRGR